MNSSVLSEKITVILKGGKNDTLKQKYSYQKSQSKCGTNPKLSICGQG